VEDRERCASARRPAERVALVSRTNREGGSGSLEKERQEPNARRAALGTEVCGISISVLGLGNSIDFRRLTQVATGPLIIINP
jgi:hypothetical protein